MGTTDLASALAADQAEDLARQATHVLGSLVQPEQYVGEVFAISYESALVQVHDFHRQKVGGIPATCFLIATRISGAVDERIDYTLEDSSIILLRVLDAAALPTEQEVVRLKTEAAQRASGEEKHWDAPDVVDASMHYLISFAGVKCRVLGTFFLDTNPEGLLSLRFGSDLSNFYPSKGLKVYKPNRDTLERIVNFRDPNRDDVYFKEEVTLGEVRYASTNRSFQGVSKVAVRMNPADLLGQKTALFGMTRVGKSNTTKVLAKTVFNLRPAYRVGQLIFDPNGEYANENVQDQDGNKNPSALRNVWRSHGESADTDVVTYGLQPHQTDPERKLMLLNFYADSTLEVGKEIINASLAPEASSKYISNFIDVRFEEPPSEEQGELTRHRRRVLVYRALLARAGFRPPKAIPLSTKGLFNKKLLETMESLGGKFAFGAEVLGAPKSWEQLAEAVEALLEFMGQSSYQSFENAYMAEARDKGSEPRPWADENLKKILGMFHYPNGPKLLGRVVQQHTDSLNNDYAVEIYESLSQGKLVIVDQSGGDEVINRSSAERIARHLFYQNQAIFRSGKTPPDIIVYTEEAHTLLPDGSDEDFGNIWVRTAKEGAKYNIGMIYATQEPSSIQKNILKNTVNWFLGHLNNTDETKELQKFYDFEDFRASILRAQDKGFLRMKTLSNIFTVPVQVVRFQV